MSETNEVPTTLSREERERAVVLAREATDDREQWRDVGADEWADSVLRYEATVTALESQLQEVGRWFREFGEHDSDCHAIHPHKAINVRGCSCGKAQLARILTPDKAPLP